jgi:hypothetical protein
MKAEVTVTRVEPVGRGFTTSSTMVRLTSAQLLQVTPHGVVVEVGGVLEMWPHHQVAWVPTKLTVRDGLGCILSFRSEKRVERAVS